MRQLSIFRPGRYIHFLAHPTVDAVKSELRKEWGRAAPQFVIAILRQLNEHRGYRWTKRIMGNVVHFSRL